MFWTAELVERVVLLGAPISINNENWEAARKVIRNLLFQHAHLSYIYIFVFYEAFSSAALQMVAGRFVNAYSTNDWMLGVAFRARYA